MPSTRTSIKLPFNGRISEVSAEVTQYVQVGQTLAVADGLKTSEVEAQVPIERFRMLAAAVTDDTMPIGITPETLIKVVEKLGIKAVVRLRTGGNAVEWEGRFARVSDTIDPNTRTIGAIVAVADAYAQAIPGVRPPLTKGMFKKQSMANMNTFKDLIERED